MTFLIDSIREPPLPRTKPNIIPNTYIHLAFVTCLLYFSKYTISTPAIEIKPEYHCHYFNLFFLFMEKID